MGYGSIIEQTINFLKHRLEMGQGVFEIYSGEGDLCSFKCSFNQPATIKEIEEFEASMGVVLPEYYKNFLLVADYLTTPSMVENHIYILWTKC
ncbi:SMI1/KNR4 family protein [Ammoniphilus sp. 3BR4]